MASHNAADIRSLMNLLDEALVKKPTILTEGPLTGLKAAFGDGRAQGQLQRADLADRMKKEWSVWLGQTGNQGTIEDMVKFLNVRVGLDADDIRGIMGHDAVGEEPNPDIEDNYEPAYPPAKSQSRTQATEPADDEAPAKPRGPDNRSAYEKLSPEQKAELEANGEITLPDGKRLWVGDKSKGSPETLRKVKDEEVQGAVNDLVSMSDQEFDDFIKNAIDSDIQDEEWAPIEAELQRRQAEMSQSGKEEEAQDIDKLMAELQHELGLRESILIERALSKDQAAMVFDDAAKYVFAHGILDREAAKTSLAGRSSGRGGVEVEGGNSQSATKIRAFLRQNDITDEMVHSMRETARRARSLGSFKGGHDHKVLAMIGLAFLKYRD